MIFITDFSLIRKEPVKIYIHHEGQFLDLNGRMGIKVIIVMLLILNILIFVVKSVPNTRVQMQLSWLHVKMLDQSMKSQQSDYKCNGSVPYDTCMYAAVIKVRCHCSD